MPTRKRGSMVPLRIGLVNNMPDAALEGTETQFSELLEAAAGPRMVHLCLAYLWEVPRSAEAVGRLQERYWPIDRLLKTPLDALIVTGAEPREPSLRQERYWNRLVDLLGWAEGHTTSSVWSCLAAHAAVLHLDDVERRPLTQKCCGVFAHGLEQHLLAEGVVSPARIPHSRWNDLVPEELAAAGYEVIARSPECGAGIFLKERGQSLFVFVQGHPEYDERALLKEYRRDVERYLTREQSHYPTLPAHYFSNEVVEQLEGFQGLAMEDRSLDHLEAFPFAEAAAGLQRKWREPGVRFYRNWLAYLAERRRATRLHDHVSFAR